MLDARGQLDECETIGFQPRADLGDEHRGAHFACAAALALADGTERVVEGQMRGRLNRKPLGENGFGYDPIFVPDGGTRTSAEMAPAEKDAISHRGAAVRALLAALDEAGARWRGVVLGAFVLPEPHLKLFHRLPLETVARAIDLLDLKGLVGSVAGDDTVLLVSRTPDGGAALAADMLRLAEQRR